MEVVNYIRDLLYHHDCVVVPGFGGFVTNERSSRIDRASNSFYPPSRDVGFNARLDHNDGLLISYISARLSINYVDARKMVEAFTEKVTHRLESGRSLSFEGIGNFVVDRQNNLHFEPDLSANFLTGAYGLSFFRFPALEDTMTEKRIRKMSEEALTGGRRRARKLLRYAAIGIPLIAALTWGAMNSGLIREFRFDLSSLNPFTAVVDSGLKVAPYEAGEPVAEPPSYVPEAGEVGSMRQALMYEEVQPADAHETAETEAIQPATSRMHYIMAGSFRSMQNARIHSAKLELEGYNCQIIQSEGGWYRVSPYSSDSGPEALQMLRRFRAEEGRSDYWLLSR